MLGAAVHNSIVFLKQKKSLSNLNKSFSLCVFPKKSEILYNKKKHRKREKSTVYLSNV